MRSSRWVVLGLAFTLVTCASVRDARQPVPRLAPHVIAETHELISQGLPLLALQQISVLERIKSDTISIEQLEELREESIAQVVSLFRNAVDHDDFDDAYRYFVSLQNIAKADRLAGWSAERLLFARVEELVQSGDVSMALLISLRALTAGTLDEEDYRLMLDLAQRAGNSSATRIIVSHMEEHGISVDNLDPSPGNNGVPIGEMIRGTVTMWVDRGIRIERGVGYPERIIGSGFFVDRRGYLLTNYHIVESEVDPTYEGYSRLYVKPASRSDDKIPARVVGYDRIFDLALVKVEIDPEYVFSSAGDPSIEPGDKIFAIGSPGGLEKTLSSGIVSAVGRRFLQMGDAIQVDVPLNPGSSGGPLLNERGELVGVVFAGLEQFEGINFAIPYNWVNKVLPRLFEGGFVSYPWIGTAVHEVGTGLEVIYTVPGEPGERIGLQRGDVIVEMNDRSVTTVKDLHDAILRFDPQTLATLAWVRGDVRVEGAVTLGPRPFSPMEVALERDTRDSIIYPLFGMQIERLSGILWNTRYVVTDVLAGSVADESSISKDDTLRVQVWQVDQETKIAILQIHVKRRKTGALESVIHLIAYLEGDNFV